MKYSYFLGSRYSAEEYEKLDFFFDPIPKSGVVIEDLNAELNINVYDCNPIALKRDGTVLFWKPFSNRKKKCVFEYGKINYAFISREDLFNPACYISLIVDDVDFFICWDNGDLNYCVPRVLLEMVVLDTGVPLVYGFYSSERESFLHFSYYDKSGKLVSETGFNVKGEMEFSEDRNILNKIKMMNFEKTLALKGVLNGKME